MIMVALIILIISCVERVSEAKALDALFGYRLLVIMPFAFIIRLGSRYVYVHFYMAHRQLVIAVSATIWIFMTGCELLLKSIKKGRL